MLSVADLGVVADDLTGACDVAAAFAAAAGSVRVHVRPGPRRESRRDDLVVVNTQSRLLRPAQARAVAERVGQELVGERVIFVKVDSALRGAVGALLEGLLQAVGRRKVVVAPAIPRIGRTTRGGIQYDCGTPIDKTAFADDPVSPIRSARLAQLLGRTGNPACEIRDAETDEDLREIVRDALTCPQIVLVGSLGLADALTEELDRIPARSGAAPLARSSRRPLIVCGPNTRSHTRRSSRL